MIRLWKSILFALFVISNIFTLIFGARPFTIDFDVLDYDINPEFVNFIDFKLIPYKGHQAVNGTIIFRRDVVGMRLVHWVTSTKSDGRLWNIYNITVNGCDILANKYSKLNVIMEAVVQRIKQAIPAIPKKCPLKKEKKYSLLNFFLDEEMMPVYVPNIKIQTAFNVLSRMDFVLKLRLTAHVESKIGKRNGEQTNKKSI
ncbi:uncharacterized protein LOC101896871 [Musca domestica]|uniref:Uncharacterized protein LOC101896871 n=1 Tax=Musca domestica TaxID=7370 RepID=A0A1I8MSE6_MUSDO|nr:uncharacterized protein LOC101896871 [Musca domestica]